MPYPIRRSDSTSEVRLPILAMNCWLLRHTVGTMGDTARLIRTHHRDALYRYLTERETGGRFAGEIEWNFTKLLVGRDGVVVARFPSKISPQDPKMIVAIEDALSAPEPPRGAAVENPKSAVP